MRDGEYRGVSQLADVYLWDVAAGKELRHFPAHQGWVSVAELLPRRPDAATTGAEPMIRLWDVATGREVVPQSGHRSAIRNLVVSPARCDDLHGGHDGTIRHWDTSHRVASWTSIARF